MAKSNFNAKSTEGRKKPVSSPKGSNNLYWLLLVAVILVALFIRVRLAGAPLERDEGDYATNAMLLLDGVSLSSDLIMKRFTLIYYLYMAFLTIFGNSDTGIHLGLMVFNLATIGGIYLLGTELKDQRMGILSASIFAIFSLSHTLNGINANREHFLVFFAVFGIWYLIKALKNRVWWQYLVAGFLIGASFGVKQHGALLLLFGGLWLIYYEFAFNKASVITVIKNGLIYSIGGLFLFGMIMLQYKLVGAFDGFYENTFQSSAQYVQMGGPSEGWNMFKTNFGHILNKNFLILLLVIPGLVFFFSKNNLKKYGVFLGLLLILSFAATAPGWYFRPHYFMIVAPVISILAAFGVEGFRQMLNGKTNTQTTGLITGLLLLAAIIQPLVSQAHYFFEADDVEASHIVYQYNPFPEAEVLGEFIQNNTNSDAEIMVLGSEPELYFYSQRKPAISAYYMYRLMRGTELASKRQQEIIEEAETDPPEMIVFYDVPVSWLKTPKSDLTIFNWFNQFGRQYQLVGIADILPNGTNYVFGAQARNYAPRSSGKIYLFSKR